MLQLEIHAKGKVTSYRFLEVLGTFSSEIRLQDCRYQVFLLYYVSVSSECISLLSVLHYPPLQYLMPQTSGLYPFFYLYCSLWILSLGKMLTISKFAFLTTTNQHIYSQLSTEINTRYSMNIPNLMNPKTGQFYLSTLNNISFLIPIFFIPMSTEYI